MQDQKITELIRTDNNDRALVVLYRHFPMIRKMILSNGGNAEDAEDIFQETLIILCRKVKNPGFELTARLSTYLFSVSLYLWKDELKKRKHHIRADFETGLKEAEEKELEDIIEKESRARLAEKILDQLGDRCRELLLLFYKGGMKLKAIAAYMGYNSENTAKNQKYKCLEGARNRLKELKPTTQTFNN
ncbi:MAG: sigma-70 family RNA polymerase sigma factor [Bacteroidota bacterium]|nr:sigma-70 family RNA polymerase sigma factor [Bacteroidota bacterium]